jgi:hypothetical protein
MTAIPTDPDALLTSSQLSAALTQAGYRIARNSQYEGVARRRASLPSLVPKSPLSLGRRA